MRKAKRVINNQIVTTLISSIIFAIIIIVSVVMAVSMFYNHQTGTKKVGHLIVDYKESNEIKTKLEQLPTLQGLETKLYELTITNNTDEVEPFTIYVKNLSEEKITNATVVGLNGFIVKQLTKFPQDEEYYILYKGELKPKYSMIITLNFWNNEEIEEEFLNQELNVEFGIFNE